MRTGSALAVLLTVLTATACTTSPASLPTASSPAPASTIAPDYGPVEYRQLRVCTMECDTTGAIPFQHPRWGAAWLLTFQAGGPDATEAHESGLLAVGQDGTIRWSWKGGDWPVLHPAEPATDRTGHLFVLYNPGRYDGLLVLGPTESGFDDFATLPGEAQLPTSRFYSVALEDPDGDGVYEIREDINDCEPNCAEGTHHSVIHRWDGSDYRPR